MLRTDTWIGDHAVLQHGQEISIAGTALPNHQLLCELGDMALHIKSADDGTFEVTFPPMSPSGPLSFQIRDIDGYDRLIYRDIYLGNVYLIAGQSNMALTLGQAADVPLKEADKLIRQFEVKKQALLNPALAVRDESWKTAEADDLEDFSAIGFYFARVIREEFPDVAIGLVNASYGGTNIEAWISREGLLESPTTRDKVKEYEAGTSAVADSLSVDVPDRGELEREMLEGLFPEPFPNAGVDKCWQESGFDDHHWDQMVLPDSWTLAGYNCPGIFWYRREVEVPATWAGQPLELHLGAVDHQDISYWNGTEIGRTGDGLEIGFCNKLRCYDIPPELVNSGKNYLAVRALSFFPVSTNGGLIGPEDEMYLRCDRDPARKIPLTGIWKYQPERILSLEAVDRCRHLGAGEPHSYHIMFDNMIYPVRRCKFSAVLYYQGEANTLGETGTYEGLLKVLINDWRSCFGQNDLPFIIVQLPGFHTPRAYSEHSQWAKIRNAQLRAGLSIGIPPVVLAESGLAADLHPPDKRTAGRRSAMVALALKGKDGVPISGPVYRCMEALPGGRIRLHFELYGSRLVIRSGRVKHLVIAGSDGVFHEAKSEVESPVTLLVWSDAVTDPEIVCYGWCENPAQANLCNQAGQPASPFRTDMDYSLGSSNRQA